MKLVTALVVSALSLAFGSARAVDAGDCDVTKLTPLLTDADLVTCATESGLTLPPATAPTADILTKACSVPACVRLMSKVAALDIGDCTLGTIKLTTDLLAPAKAACASTSATSNSTSTTTNGTAPSSASPNVTTAPITTEGDMGSSLAGSEGGSHASADDSATTSAANTSTSVPSPATTKSGASRVGVVAAVSLVVAVAATLM